MPQLYPHLRVETVVLPRLFAVFEPREYVKVLALEVVIWERGGHLGCTSDGGTGKVMARECGTLGCTVHANLWVSRRILAAACHESAARRSRLVMTRRSDSRPVFFPGGSIAANDSPVATRHCWSRNVHVDEQTGVGSPVPAGWGAERPGGRRPGEPAAEAAAQIGERQDDTWPQRFCAAD